MEDRKRGERRGEVSGGWHPYSAYRIANKYFKEAPAMRLRELDYIHKELLLEVNEDAREELEAEMNALIEKIKAEL